MHNLAIALHRKGYRVTGSDDQIFEPSRGRLGKEGILPESEGWHPEKITEDLDAIILGMHARADNPELKRAEELGLKIFSYPEYLYEQAKDKERVVIGGSHGKTSITAMILHVLHKLQTDTDYMVGAQLEGFDCMVRLSDTAEIAVFEGDEYLSSPIDRRPKFHLYKPHIAVLSGIAWDHINVFPTWENYVEQFRIFIDLIEPDGTLIYCTEDAELRKLAEAKAGLQKKPYGIHPHRIENGTTILITDSGEEVPVQIFGEHNLMNLNAARLVCLSLGVSEPDFYRAVADFTGASKRLERIALNDQTTVYKDFAHSPSKLVATTEAVQKQFPDRKLVACMELHTFSSLNKEFLQQYAGTMDSCDTAIVYFNPKTIAHKKLEPLSAEEVKAAFQREDLIVLTETQQVLDWLKSYPWPGSNLLLMTSGNFDGVNLDEFARELLVVE
ncbi:MAG: peptidoglycan synthetase [Cryomorphaceae bacterium]|nr:MAG: peptidoglycan synthetase [Cryomorphaceae bacterium]